MAKSAVITLTTAGTSTGPFNLLSDVDGYVTPFESNVPKASLVAGYTTNLIPNTAVIIRVKSTGVCTNYIDLVYPGETTTTTTSTTSTTTSGTTSTTTTSTTTTTTTNTPYDDIAGSFTVSNAGYSIKSALVSLGGYGTGATISAGNTDTLSPIGQILTPNSAAFTITSTDGTDTITVLSNTLSCTNASVSVAGSGTTTVTITVTPTNYNSSTDTVSGDISVGIS